ncbi:MAG: glutamine synthetase adenylyltransferase, partial [Anaerolineae bacterium]
MIVNTRIYVLRYNIRMNATLLSEQDCQHLLNGTLPHERAIRLMARAGFADPEAARLALQKMAAGPEGGRWPARFLAPLLLALSKAASPDRVLVNLERMAQNVPNRRAFFKTLAQNPRALQILVTLFAGSQFLTEILLGAPHYFERLGNHRALARPQSRADFAQKARAAIEPVSGPDAQLDALRRFQRWQLLRIGTGDLLGLLNLPTITAQLSHLADALVQVCLSLAARHTGTDPAGFVVLGMGKLGGEELNYSSDIDLLFLAAGNAASFERLGKRLIDALTRVTAAGFLYRVDMRLRPWGKMGALVTPVEGHLAYLQRQARRWEKQALLKARVVAGDGAVGGHFLQRAAPLIMAATPQQAQTDIRAMKQRIETNLRRQGRQWGEVKLGQGSIRDIEFVTQYLQLAHGSARPHLLTPNTLRAMRRLAQDNLLTPDEYRILSDGYTFLRSVEHWLQMLHYRQTHTLPTDPGELADLARRLGFTDGNAKDTFLARYEQHTIAIRLVYQSHLEPEAANASPSPAPKAPPPPMLQKHLARLSPAYITTFSQTDIERHAALAERISPDNPVEVDAIPLNEGRWQVTIVGYDYLGELSLICG